MMHTTWMLLLALPSLRPTLSIVRFYLYNRHFMSVHPHFQPIAVVNGQKNAMTITVEKKSDNEVIVTRISAAFLHPDTNTLLKNVC